MGAKRAPTYTPGQVKINVKGVSPLLQTSLTNINLTACDIHCGRGKQARFLPAVSFPGRVTIEQFSRRPKGAFRLTKWGMLIWESTSFFFFCPFVFFPLWVWWGFSLLVWLPELVPCRMSWAQLSASGRGREESPEGRPHSWSVASCCNYTDTTKPHQKAAREDGFSSTSLG